MLDQPDLFAATREDLRSEISRNGGGTPPRWIAPAPDAPPEGAADDFSPVRTAELLRALERSLGVVTIRRVSLAQMAEELL